MGATKRLGEILTKNQGKGYSVVRFGNVMNSRGSLLKIWQRQSDEGKPLTVTDRGMERYMMTIPEAVNLIVEATEMSSGGETFILDMGERINIYDLALQITGKIPQLTGMRPGETLTEELMTAEEKALATKIGPFYVFN